MIDESKNIVRQLIIRVTIDTNYSTAYEETLYKYQSLSTEVRHIPTKLKKIIFANCFKETEAHMKEQGVDVPTGHNPEINNYLETSLSTSMELLCTINQICTLNAEKQKTPIQQETIDHKQYNDLLGKLYSNSACILEYLSELEILIIQEKIPFIKAIYQFLTTVSNKIKGYKNKFLDWQIQSKK